MNCLAEKSCDETILLSLLGHQSLRAATVWFRPSENPDASGHQRTQTLKLDSLECSNCAGSVDLKISLCPWKSMDNCTRPAISHWVSALWQRACFKLFLPFRMCSEGSVQPIHPGPNSLILQNVLSTHDPKYRHPETLERHPTWGFWGNHKILDNLQNQEPEQAKFKRMRMQRKQQNLMRVKQVKFRGRKRTDKQGAEKCLKNS